MKIKTLMLTMLIVISTKIVFAQQEAMFTHYMFNTLSINPGYAGSRDALTIALLDRNQWVGFEGAPRTQTLTIHSPLMFPNMGAGLSVVNDKIGPLNFTSVYADYSYKIQVSKTSHLVFGLKAGTTFMRNGLTGLDLQNPDDPSFSNDYRSEILPNFGFGLYYFTDKYYLGFSIPKILENDYNKNISSGATNIGGEAKNYFIIAGYLFTLDEYFKLKPTTFLKITAAAPIELDVSAQLYYKDRIWGGLMYRTGDAVGVLVGANLTKSLAFGYSYDWSFTNRSFRYNGGSHEIVLIYDFIFTEGQKVRSPRYF